MLLTARKSAGSVLRAGRSREKELRGNKRNRLVTKMTGKLKSDKGITLIEILTTAVIIGIVAAMAVPRFQIAFDRMKFRSADREIFSTLRVARSKAITDKEPYGVYFDGTAKTFTLFKDKTNPGTHVYESGDSVVTVDTLPSEFAYLGTDVSGNVIFFERNGSAYFVGQGNIVTVACTESVVAVNNHNVLASTGRVHSSSAIY